MVVIATYVAIVSFIDARVEERHYFSVLKYVVGTLAAIPIAYVLYKMGALYRHPMLLLKYVIISTLDVIDSSIFDRLYIGYVKKLTKDITADRYRLLGCKTGRLEYADLSEYRLLRYQRVTVNESRADTRSTQIIINSTIGELLEHLMRALEYGDGVRELVVLYLERINIRRSVHVEHDQDILKQYQELRNTDRSQDPAADTQVDVFMARLLSRLFTEYSATDDDCVKEYVKAMGTVYGSLESYKDIQLEDTIDCIFLNGKPMRLGEGGLMYTEPQQASKMATRLVMQRNINDWYLYYISLLEEAHAKSLLECLPTNRNNYEGKLLTEKRGVYDCLSYKEFLRIFSLRHEECHKQCHYSDTVVYFSNDSFNTKWTAYEKSNVVVDFQLNRLEGKSGWLV
ncbi:hypothetical protein GGI12_003820 [Dipsacomyces acuminosporus]|nr:hypothetical protein GGI12_003820 [Dipsacomyces acuminosporus]